jgi:excinuclease ABC subunit C
MSTHYTDAPAAPQPEKPAEPFPNIGKTGRIFSKVWKTSASIPSMQWPENIRQKLKELPDEPGVYLMRGRTGAIIYVGKAASLRKRVQSYFRESTFRKAEPKLRGLIRSITDFDILVLRTEAEAVLTEGKLIKEYKPRYNSMFKDDKRFPLLRTDLRKPFPKFELCRIDKNDGALYFGPYTSGLAARAALEFVEKRFGIRQCRPDAAGRGNLQALP